MFSTVVLLGGVCTGMFRLDPYRSKQIHIEKDNLAVNIILELFRLKLSVIFGEFCPEYVLLKVLLPEYLTLIFFYDVTKLRSKIFLGKKDVQLS